MSKICISLFLIFSIISPHVFGQKPETILRAPSNWNSEIIAFPLGFAPQIELEGFEDIRFAPGWSNMESEEFWTYHFSWYIEKEEAMTEDFLAETCNLYYDGLARAVLEGQSDSTHINKLQNTISLFVKTKGGFSGKMRVFDSFFTKDYITLNVKVREKICEETNKQIVSFDLSPKSFEDKVWEIFKDVQLIEKCE